MVLVELFYKIVPVLFTVIHAIKTRLPDICLYPFIMFVDGRYLNYEKN